MSPYSFQQPNDTIQSTTSKPSRLIGKWNMQHYRNEDIFRPTPIRVESMQERFIKKIMACIEQHMSNPQLCVDRLAVELCLSNIQLYRKLKALTGHTPNELIRNIRLQRAAELLIQQADHVSRIAYQVGFSNLSYFSKCFRKKYGLTPSEFQDKKKSSSNTYYLLPPLPITQRK